MEFKDFFSMMKNRISDGTDVPYFFRNLMAMITDVTEEEWGTPKDPNTKLTNDNTLRTYANENHQKSLPRVLFTACFRKCLLSRWRRGRRLFWLY